MVQEKPIGKVSSYFSNINVAAIELTDKLKIGDTIKIKGSTTDLIQQVDSMQIDKVIVKEAKKGNSVGIKVNEKVRANDLVYKA
jgi:putative protease